jgi:hypothetical protein
VLLEEPVEAHAIADEEVVKHALEVAQGELVGPEETHCVHHRVERKVEKVELELDGGSHRSCCSLDAVDLHR